MLIFSFTVHSQVSSLPCYFNCVKKISTNGTYISTDTLRNYWDITSTPAERGIIPMPGGNYLAAGTIDDPWANTFPWNQDGFVYNSVTKQTVIITGTRYKEVINAIKPLPGGTGAVVVGYSDGICTPADDPALGLKDLWMVRFNLDNSISGNVYIDANNNNTQEAGEITLKDVRITSKSANTQITTQPYSANGDYRISVSPGTYTTKLQLPRPYYTSTPDSVNTTFSTYNQPVTANFALHPIAGIKDYAVNVSSSRRVRPGFDHTYYINCTNSGTDTLNNRDLLFIKDHRFSFTNAEPAPTSVSGDSIVWNIASLFAGDIIFFFIKTNGSHHARN